MSLRLSCLTTEVDNETLVAICIIGSTESEALGVAEIALSYYEDPGPKPGIHVSISRLDSSYKFVMDFGGFAGCVEIDGIDPSSLSGFLDFLPESPGYGIFLAYGHTDTRFVTPSKFSMIKQDIIIDGRAIVLESRNDLWKLVKDSISS